MKYRSLLSNHIDKKHVILKFQFITFWLPDLEQVTQSHELTHL